MVGSLLRVKVAKTILSNFDQLMVKAKKDERPIRLGEFFKNF